MGNLLIVRRALTRTSGFLFVVSRMETEDWAKIS